MAKKGKGPGWHKQHDRHRDAAWLGWAKRKGLDVSELKVRRKKKAGKKSKANFKFKNASTWREFIKKNMGPAMKHFGGHGPAIKAMGKYWKGRTDPWPLLPGEKKEWESLKRKSKKYNIHIKRVGAANVIFETNARFPKEVQVQLGSGRATEIMDARIRLKKKRGSNSLGGSKGKVVSKPPHKFKVGDKVHADHRKGNWRRNGTVIKTYYSLDSVGQKTNRMATIKWSSGEVENYGQRQLWKAEQVSNDVLKPIPKSQVRKGSIKKTKKINSVLGFKLGEIREYNNYLDIPEEITKAIPERWNVETDIVLESGNTKEMGWFVRKIKRKTKYKEGTYRVGVIYDYYHPTNFTQNAWGVIISVDVTPGYKEEEVCLRW